MLFQPGHAGGWSAYVLVMALSIHSVLEGVAIGVSGNVEELITLFISIIVHEVSWENWENCWHNAMKILQLCSLLPNNDLTNPHLPTGLPSLYSGAKAIH